MDDVLEELESHISRLRHVHARAQFEGASLARYGLQEPLLVSAWKLASKRKLVGSFSDFLDRFAGRNFPRADLIEYFDETLGVEYDAMTETFDAVHRRQDDLGNVFG